MPLNTPDDLVQKIFVLREAKEPDADPGDITIEIQDDMDFVTINQRGQCVGMGSSIQSAVQNAVSNITNGNAANGQDLWSFDEAWDNKPNHSLLTKQAREIVCALLLSCIVPILDKISEEAENGLDPFAAETSLRMMKAVSTLTQLCSMFEKNEDLLNEILELDYKEISLGMIKQEQNI